MSSDLALEVEQLGKLYPIYDHPRDRLLQAFWGNRKQLFRPFWALQNVSFQLKRGQTLGQADPPMPHPGTKREEPTQTDRP